MTELRPDAPLTGRVVRVEPMEERHREGLRRAAAEDPSIFRYMVYPGDFDVWFDDALASADDPFVVTVDGREVGSTRYLFFEPVHLRVEIGWTWLAPSAHGTGANAETKLLLCEHAFEQHGLQRVEFKTDRRNERTRAALLGIGTRFEGIFRKHMRLPAGDIRDSAWYAIVDDDWPAAREQMRARVARQAP